MHIPWANSSVPATCQLACVTMSFLTHFVTDDVVRGQAICLDDYIYVRFYLEDYSNTLCEDFVWALYD